MAKSLLGKTAFHLHCGDSLEFIKSLPTDVNFNLVFTSPPYNLGKVYETKSDTNEYLDLISPILEESAKRLADDGSFCLQVGLGLYEDKTTIPLDYLFFPIMRSFGLQFKQRVIWHFRHGFPASTQFDQRHEVVMWFVKGKGYKFNLDDVRIPQLYPNYKKKGVITGNPKGKNPGNCWEIERTENLIGDFWDNIPNVKSGHCEIVPLDDRGTKHPCQFPVGLVERFVLATTDKNDMVFDPFAGVASAGVAALANGRRFLGCDKDKSYVAAGVQRLYSIISADGTYRPHNAKIPDPPQPKK
jgi:adenine-specific DNA-methyltransferase